MHTARLAATAIFLAGISAALATAPAQAATVHCGEIVDHSITLTRDVTGCTGDGIVAGADGIVIRLGGHRITGSTGSLGASGINLRGHNHVTIVGGPGNAISHFTTGLTIVGDDNVVRGVMTIGSGAEAPAVDVVGSRNLVADSVQRQAATGIEIRSNVTPNPPESHNTVMYDHVTDAGTGIFLEDTAGHNTVSHSTITDSGTGILVEFESDDTIASNTTTGNGQGNGVWLVGAKRTLLAANAASRQDVGFAFGGCLTNLCGPDDPSSARAVNNRASRNAYGYDAGTRSFVEYIGNHATLNRAAGFRDIGGDTTMSGNVAGSASCRSGGTDGNGIGILIKDDPDPFFPRSTGELRGNLACGNRGGPDGAGGIIFDAIGGPSLLQGNKALFNAGDGIRFSTFAFVTVTSNVGNRNERFGIEGLGDSPDFTDGGGNRATGNGLGQCVNLTCH